MVLQPFDNLLTVLKMFIVFMSKKLKIVQVFSFVVQSFGIVSQII